MTRTTRTLTAAHRSIGSTALCVLALALLTWADLATKDWALANLSRAPSIPAGEVCRANEEGLTYFQRLPTAPRVWIDNYLELRYAENCGAAFGVLNNGPSWLRLLLFAPAAAAAVLGLLWLYYSGYGGRLFTLSVPLIASGALGNLIDRFRLGYVVDFVRFHLRDGFSWPTFNVADITITVGVGLLLIEGFAAPSRTQRARAATPERASTDA
jgi:signal peptidase II